MKEMLINCLIVKLYIKQPKKWGKNFFLLSFFVASYSSSYGGWGLGEGEFDIRKASIFFNVVFHLFLNIFFN